jgi:hypothetical protein
MRAKSLVAVAVAWTLTGCARGAMPDGSAASNRKNVITQEQLAGTNTDNLYDAIVKIHPDWLTSRGPTSVSNPTPTVVSVFINGTMLGKADYLREMRVLDVSEVRYWDVGQATARFGNGHPRGVIEVTRK